MTDAPAIVSWDSLAGLEKTMGEAPARALAKKLLGFLEGKAAELEKAFADGDPETVRACLHKLSSNAAALGALPLSQTARALERDCAEGRWDSVQARQAEVLDLAVRSLAALKERLS